MARATYHHGALEQALVDAAVAIARQHGPAALSVRSIAAEVGVSPAAVYRHFESLDHLVARVSQVARHELGVALTAARARPVSARTAAKRARARMAAVGSAYIRFALDEPQLFDTAFTPCPVMLPDIGPSGAWDVLLACVDELVTTGAIPASRAREAPLIAWSGVHGLAMILVRGVSPVAMDADTTIATVVEALVRSVEGPTIR